MANQDFTRENKKPTTHDKQKRLAEEELEKRISRLQLAIKKEKDPKLKQEISLLLQQYETEHKNLLQKKLKEYAEIAEEKVEANEEK